MKRKLLAVLAIVLVTMAMTPAVASATTWHYWHNVGGDPLVSGGVNTMGKFSYQMLNSSKVRKATSLVASADKLPSWVRKSADAELAAGDIHATTLAIGSKVGAMSYGKRVVRVMQNTIYHGQYKSLAYYYVTASNTTTVTISGVKYRQTVSYRVSMAKKCGNVFIWYMRTVRTRIPVPPIIPCPTYKLYVEKRQDSATGPRLAGWTIHGSVASSVGPEGFNVQTETNYAVLVGEFPTGRTYDFSELQQAGWEIVSPTGGEFRGTIGTSDVILTFVNRRVITPPPVHLFSVNGSGEFSCLDPEKVSGDLIAAVATHSDTDTLTYTWTVNGVDYVTTNTRFGIDFAYEKWYNITLTAKDAVGNVATSTLAPRYFSAPGTLPQPN